MFSYEEDREKFLVNEESYKEIGALLKKIEGYPYALIKGVPLSLYSYGNVSSRKSHDFDILVSKNSIAYFENILNDYGFDGSYESREDRILALTYSHQTKPFVKKVSNDKYICIDLNFDLFWGEYDGERISVDEFIADTVSMDIYGYKVQTLNPIKTLLQIILHHYKEINSIYHLHNIKKLNISMFTEVYNLLKRHHELISIDTLYKMGEKYNIIPYIYYMLYYTNRIYNDHEIQKYVENLYTKEGEDLLNVYGLSKNEKKTWTINFDERLLTTSLSKYIELSDEDIKKINNNRRIFGLFK